MSGCFVPALYASVCSKCFLTGIHGITEELRKETGTELRREQTIVLAKDHNQAEKNLLGNGLCHHVARRQLLDRYGDRFEGLGR